MKTKLHSATTILTIFLIISILALPIIYIKPAFAAPIFTDGFESGSFSAWTVQNGGFVTSGSAFDGTYKAVLNVSGQYNQAKFTNIADCFMRAYVMFKSFPASGTDTTIFGVFNLNGNYTAEARVANVSGTVQWELRYFDAGVSHTVVSAQQMPVLNTWYCVEVEGKANSAANTEARMYVNGQELTDVTQTGKDNPNLINCGYIWIQPGSGAVTVWYDDVAIDSAYIGPETAKLAVNPATSYVTLEKSFNITVNITAVVGLTSWQFKLYYEKNLLSCNNATEGPFLKTGGSTFFNMTITNNYNDTHGCLLAYCTLLGSTQAGGSGALATVNFTALADGDASLTLSETKLGDTNIPPNPINHVDIDGIVHVQSFTLNLTISPVEGGSVNLNETGPYHYGEIVSLTAVPTIGWTFSGWSGNFTGSTNPHLVNITGDTAVTAAFTQDQYTLTITSAHGSVVKSPDQPTYTWGTNVTLTLTVDAGYTFTGWSGDASGTALSVTINMTGNKAVTAAFTQDQYTLTITSAHGSVVKSPDQPTYTWGTNVTLTATPDAGWSFQYWSGASTDSTNTTTINMTSSMTVTANYINKPTLQMSPTSKTCRVYHENFTVTITVSSDANFKDFNFTIHYNTTLLDYVSVTWGIWGSGSASITVDEPNGKITVSNSGTAISGTQTLVTINFTVSLHRIFKYGTTENPWTNDLIDTIYFQSINISYPTGPDLQYQRGDSTQISVGPAFAYTFSPIKGDLDNNGVVDIFDLRTVAAYFDTSNPTYDLNMDGTIDVADIQIVASNYDFKYVP